MSDNLLILVFCYINIILLFLNHYLKDLSKKIKSRLLDNIIVFITAIQIFILFAIILMVL